MKRSHLLFTLLFITLRTAAQDQAELTRLAAVPRTNAAFPLHYKILQPRLKAEHWDKDYEFFYQYITPELRRGLQHMSMTVAGTTTMIAPTAVISHAELDTATRIKTTDTLDGLWRMLVFRKLRFNDSSDLRSQRMYRHDTLLDDQSRDEGFMIVKGGRLQLLYRPPGKTKFRKRGSGRFTLINGRYMKTSRLCNTCGNINQAGLDKAGRLILNHVSVVEVTRRPEYISWYSVVTQYIFERVR